MVNSPDKSRQIHLGNYNVSDTNLNIIKDVNDSIGVTIAKGGFAGLVSSTICYPLDTVRIRSIEKTTYDNKAPSLLKEGY